MNKIVYPLISVCIPTYNNVKNLKKVIDSVLVQKKVDFELIISDDSTTKDVKELIEEYKSKGHEIFYTHNQPALGSPRNWNNAIQMANGKYIKILHHDDWLLSDTALFELLELIKKKEKSFAFSASYSVRNEIKIFNKPTSDTNIEFNINPLKLLVGNLIGGPSSLLFPKDTGIEFDERLIWLVDVDFYLNLYFNGFESFYSPNILYCSFMDENNITNQCIHNLELNLKELSIIYRKYSNRLSFKNKIVMSIYIYRYLNQQFKISYIKTLYCMLRN